MTSLKFIFTIVAFDANSTAIDHIGAASAPPASNAKYSPQALFIRFIDSALADDIHMCEYLSSYFSVAMLRHRRPEGLGPQQLFQLFVERYRLEGSVRRAF